MDEEPQVRGCHNITFICTPTKQETVFVGEWGWGVEGSRLEAWIKSHKSEVAIT